MVTYSKNIGTILGMGTYSKNGHVFYKWASILWMGTYSKNAQVFYEWACILQMGTYSTNGHVFYEWAHIPQTDFKEDTINQLKQKKKNPTIYK
jgi:hypothetical protein